MFTQSRFTCRPKVQQHSHCSRITVRCSIMKCMRPIQVQLLLLQQHTHQFNVIRVKCSAKINIDMLLVQNNHKLLSPECLVLVMWWQFNPNNLDCSTHSREQFPGFQTRGTEWIQLTSKSTERGSQSDTTLDLFSGAQKSPKLLGLCRES